MTLEEKREKAKNMGVWETDDDGEYAGKCRYIDPIVVLAAIPYFGIFMAMGIIGSSVQDGMRDRTGVSQMFARTGITGLVISTVNTLVTTLAFFVVILLM